jgi:two-component system sensor histidine kinase RegB
MSDTAGALVSSAINLRRVTLLRGLIVLGQVLTVLVAVYGLEVGLPLAALLAVIVLYAAASVMTWLRLRWTYPVSEAELFAQLLLDVVVLTTLLYLSGGSTNPFVVLYLLPLSLTAAALPGRHTWAMAGVTAVCYTLLLFFYRPLPDVHAGHGDTFTLHVIGMWLGFVLSAALIAFFAVRMAETLRERDRLRAAMREQQLRHERVLALGTLAAGAAHELGTPLSTMAVLARELESEPGASTDTTNKLSILRAQIDRCKEVLATLTASVGAERAEAAQGYPLDDWLHDLVGRVSALRPNVEVRTSIEGPLPAPRIVAEQTLGQAILNVLNNAADASPEQVELAAHWNDAMLEVDVCDRGPGVAPDVQQAAGRAPISTKQAGEGLGLGLFLANTTLQRFGGTIRLYNRAGGGACAQIMLPLAQLRLPA